MPRVHPQAGEHAREAHELIARGSAKGLAADLRNCMSQAHSLSAPEDVVRAIDKAIAWALARQSGTA